MISRTVWPLAFLGVAFVAACNGGGGGNGKASQNGAAGAPGASGGASRASGKSGSASGSASNSPTGAGKEAQLRNAATVSTPICTSDVTACAGQNPLSDACLTLYEACGRYVDIIDYYALQQLATTQRHYYLGVAYRGLFLRNRSAAAQCQLGQAAQAELSEYLQETTSVDNSNSLNDLRTAQQVYHATNLLEGVKAIPGCQTSGATYNDIFNFSYARGKAIAEGLFLGNPPTGVAQVVNDTRTNIQNIIGSFISGAANVETQLGLRAAAMDSSDARLNAVFVLWTNGLQATGHMTQSTGTNALGQTVQKPLITDMKAPDTTTATGVFGAQVALYCGSLGCGNPAQIGGLDGQAKAGLGIIETAMGKVDPSVYENARDNIAVPAAHAAINWGAQLQTNVQNADVASTRVDIAQQTGILSKTDDGSEYFGAIKAKFKCNGTHTGACSTTPAPWYCK